MNIEYLRYLTDVVNTKSITQAAQLNYISPQGMSRAMTELEKELGCQLLVRYPNKLGFTEQCKQLMPSIIQTLEHFDTVLDLASQFGSESSGNVNDGDTLKLLCQPISSLCFIPADIMESLLSNKSISCREAENLDIFEELMTKCEENDGQVENGAIGLTCLFDPKRSSTRRTLCKIMNMGYEYKPFLTSYDMTVISAMSPLAEKETLNHEDIRSQKIVTSSSDLRDVIGTLFGEDAIAATSANVGFRIQAVSRGDAISFMPAISAFALASNPDVVLKPFEDRYDLEIGFVGTSHDLANPAFVSFVDELRAWYQSHRDDSLYKLVWK